MDLKNTFKSRIRENKIGENIYLAQIDNYTSLTDTISKPVGKEFVQFYFCIKGSSTFHISNKETYLIEGGSSLLIFHPQKSIPINISLAKKSNLIIFVIKIQELDKMFNVYKSKLPFYEKDEYRYLIKQNLLKTEEKLILSQLENSTIDEELKSFYLKIKIEEFLIYYFSSNQQKKTNNYQIKDEQFIAQIQEIKELLLENIAYPPTIKTISEKTKLSEYKIKEGFKKLYGKPISNFILDTKLEIGKEKLDLKLKQVKEIAYDLGYENPSHFIEAFKKKYGITPKQWMMK